jgi:hypothetical protein
MHISSTQYQPGIVVRTQTASSRRATVTGSVYEPWGTKVASFTCAPSAIAGNRDYSVCFGPVRNVPSPFKTKQPGTDAIVRDLEEGVDYYASGALYYP